MNANEILCSTCYKEITNPVCSKCYLHHLKIWMKGHKISSAKQHIIVKRINNQLPKETNHEELCLLCKEENVNICFACFYFKTGAILRSLNIKSKKAETFELVFNYHPYLDKEKESDRNYYSMDSFYKEH